MSRRKRYIKGRVYLINDCLIVKHNKANSRVVAVNNDKNNVHIRRITKYQNGGLNARKGIVIEIYSDIPVLSVVESKTFRKTLKGKNIEEKRMRKTKTRLNKWDMNKIIKKMRVANQSLS